MNREDELREAAANAPNIAAFARVCMQAEKELPPVPCDLTDEELERLEAKADQILKGDA